ncbi:MAG: hypothetical protein E5X34_29420 [Mesorhizobium sp.]|uniref:hypothetical protein n=1 Tax=Mesorhizobium sp. TaxID=1871066 RepID=UPI0011F644AF|nr:hypothetical protein [Mesorhizobium sp.]TIR15327.1 MAG: hypothetical protein E5X34_29420 [Mesorhizobium sp.]
MAEAKSILPITSIAEAFTTIARLTPEEAQALQSFLGSERSFWPSDEVSDQFCVTANLIRSDADTILSIVKFIYDRLAERRGEERDAAIKAVAADHREDDLTDQEFSTLVDRLLGLLAYSEIHEKFRKLHRLERGFLPIASNFETLVDLRPDFDDSATDIVNFIPVVSMRIKTSSNDPSLRNFSFTLPLEQVAALTKCVDRMNAKLGILNARLATDPPAKK